MIAFGGTDLAALCDLVREQAYVVRSGDRLGVGIGGAHGHEVVAVLPPVYPEWLGDRTFTTAFGLRFPYVAGEMARGIATTEMVVRAAEAGLLGVFGSGGLEPDQVRAEVGAIAAKLGERRNWGANLLHSPGGPQLEDQVAAALIDERVPVVSASAFVALTPALVRCAVSGLRRDRDGALLRERQLVAKVSRTVVAEQFLRPAPAEILRVLRERGDISADEADLAATTPLATAITVEADSGGHTDGRPLTVALPEVVALRDRLAPQVPVGAAGGIGTPEAVAAAFALGAAYVVTGSINQAAVESGISPVAREMLSRADTGDVAMAPAADMFEQGARVQVLRRGTIFAGRASRLYDLYRSYASLDEVPAHEIATLERDVFGAPLDEVWAETERFWARRDPAQLTRADTDPRHRMALLFRWYLGNSTTWAMTDAPDRRADYQIWCGPAMGAFNAWTADTFLADPAERDVVQIALNLLEGAAVLTRRSQLALCGVDVPRGVRPRRLSI